MPQRRSAQGGFRPQRTKGAGEPIMSPAELRTPSTNVSYTVGETQTPFNPDGDSKMNTPLSIATVDASVLSPSGFPWRFQCAPETFLVWSRDVKDPMVMFEVCWGFIAWLEWNAPGYLPRVNPKMAAGTLLESLRWIEHVIRDSSVLDEEDYSNRNGTVVQFGSAGEDHEWHKMCKGLEALRVALETEASELDDQAGTMEMAANSSEDGSEDQVAFARSAIVARGVAKLRRDLASQILAELVANDVEAIVRRYRTSGNFGQVEETTVAVNCGSLGGAEFDADGNVVITAGTEYEVPSSLENYKVLADNSSLRGKVRQVIKSRSEKLAAK